MEKHFSIRDEGEVHGLLDTSLSRAHLWSSAPSLMELWAAFAHQFQNVGRLRELLIRATTDGEVRALAVTVGVNSSADPRDTENHRQSELSPGGFMHFLPSFPMPETMAVTSIFSSMSPWMSPSLAGFVTYPERDMNDKQWLVTYEQPSQMRFEVRAERFANERLHMDRFCTDHLLRHGVPPYDRI